MPTKSGRVKLQDVRQGKTIWHPHTGADGVTRAKSFIVTHGITHRVVGMIADEDGNMQGYTLPMYAVSDKGRFRPNPMAFHKGPQWMTFSPKRNVAVRELPDGSLCLWTGFTSRKACERYIRELAADREVKMAEPNQQNIVNNLVGQAQVEGHAKPASKSHFPEPTKMNPEDEGQPVTPDYSRRF